MKNLIIAIFTTILVFSVVGCSGSSASAPTRSHSTTEAVAMEEVSEDEILTPHNTEIAEDTEPEAVAALTENIGRTLNKKQLKTLQEVVSQNTEKIFTEGYKNYYEILGFDYKFTEESKTDGLVTSKYIVTMHYKNFDKDPDTVEYIAEAKKTNPSEYKILYKEYLAEQSMNFSMLATYTEDKEDDFKLYAHISITGFPVYMPVERFFPDTADDRLYIPYDAKKYLCSINNINPEQNSINVDIFEVDTIKQDLKSTKEKTSQKTDIDSPENVIKLIDSDINFTVNGYIQTELMSEDNTTTLYHHNLYDFAEVMEKSNSNKYFWIYTLYGDVYVIQETDLY